MNWYDGSIVEAVNLSKSRGAIFVVYVEGTDDSSKEMTTLLNNSDVCSKLNVPENFVSIKLVGGSQAYTQFAQIYQFVPVPSLFFIGNNGTPLEIIAGSAAGGVTGLCSRIDSVLIKKLGESSSTTTAKLNTPSSSQSSSSSSFIAAEQKQATINTSSNSSYANPATAEYDLVCEGEVCIRRPKQAVVQPSPDGDTGPTDPSATEISNTPPTAEPNPPATSQDIGQSSTTPPNEPDATVIGSQSSDISLDDKLERAKELLEKKRIEKLEEEKRLEREKELERRAQGQGLAELKRWQQEQELKNIQEERKREKRENELARQRIRDQIAQDRADRLARYAPIEPPKPASPSTVPQPSSSTDTSNVTRIQFKTPEGQTHIAQFDSGSTLAQLREYVRKNILTSGNFTISTVYPRKCLPVEDNNKTMRELGLSPSCALLILRGENTSSVTTGGNTPYPVANTTGFFGLLSHILWSYIIAPVQGIYTYVSSLVTGRRPTTRPARDPEPSANVQVRRPSIESDSNFVKRRKITGGEASSTGVRKEGNTYRLRDPRDSDEDNNTWNGNSTQQM